MDAQCISNTTRVCLKAMEKHFFLLVSVAIGCTLTHNKMGITQAAATTAVQADCIALSNRQLEDFHQDGECGGLHSTPPLDSHPCHGCFEESFFGVLFDVLKLGSKRMAPWRAVATAISRQNAAVDLPLHNNDLKFVIDRARAVEKHHGGAVNNFRCILWKHGRGSGKRNHDTTKTGSTTM